MVIQNSRSLNVVAGTIVNTGTISITAAGNATYLLFDNSDTFLGINTGGGGVLNLVGNNAYLQGVHGDERLTNSNHTIAGYGNLLNNAGRLTNASLVQADSPGNGLTLNPTDGTDGVINTGTMRATNGGVLTLVAGIFNNAGGIIAAVGNNGADVSRVDLNSLSITGGTLTSQGAGYIRSTGGTVALTNVLNSGAFQVTNNTSITLAGSFVNTGSVNYAAAGNATFIFLSGDVSLAGGGPITLNGGNAYLQGASSGAERLTNLENTIQGVGNLLNNSAKLTNQQLVDANVNGQTLVVNPSAGADGVVNTGTMRASNGGVLTLFDGTFNNAGGNVFALDGSRVDFNSMSLTGGNIATAGTGYIRSTGGAVYLVNVNSDADYHIINNTNTHLQDTFTNNQQISIDAAGNATFLYLSGNVSLNGGGTINMNGGNAYLQGDASGVERLTNVDNTIRGRGNLLNDSAKLTNKATVAADVNGQGLFVNPSAGADGVINHGTLQASGGGVLVLLGGAFDQFDPGTNTSPGVIHALAGSHVDLNSLSINRGTLLSTDDGYIQSTGGSVYLVNLINNSDYRIPNNTNTRLQGTIVNERSILVDAAGNATHLYLSGNVVLTGGGTVAMSGGNAYLHGESTGQERLFNLDNRILGRGNLLDDSAKLVNSSLVDANVPAQALVINPSADVGTVVGVVNAGGTLRASDTGVLVLLGGTFDNTGGTVRAELGSRVDLNSMALIGGTIATAGDGYIQSTGGSVYLVNVTSSADYHIPNNTNTHLQGTFTNTKTLSVDAGGNATHLYLSGNVTLTGAGTVNMNGVNAYLHGDTSGAERITNVNNTIRGLGNLLNNSAKLTNQSLVDANVLNQSLTINPSAGADGVVNTATMRASGGGILTLADGTFTNAGGTIAALAASRVDLSSVSLTGGTLSSSATGFIRSTGGSVLLADLTNAADYHIINSTNTILVGTINNTASISNDAGGNATHLYLSNDVTLTGAGTVNMNGGNSYLHGLTTGAERLTNADNMIRGLGNLLNNSAKLTNQSLVDADVPGNSLTVNPSAGPDGVVNTSTMRASNGGVLTLFDGTFNNTGGTVAALNASRVDLNSMSLTGGTLSSSGTGYVRSTGGSVVLSNLTNVSDYHIINNTNTILAGTISNVASISNDAGGNATHLYLSGDVTLTGAGTVTLNGGNAYFHGLSTGAERLTNQDNTIQGGGNLGNNALAITNNGTIRATAATTLVIDPSAAGITNNGLLRANAGSTLHITDGLTNFSGTTLTGGSYYAAGNLRFAGADVVTNAATITLDGTASAFTNTAGVPLSALRNLATNNGTLTLLGGRDLTTGSLTNNGTIFLGPGSTLKVIGTLSDPGVIDLSTGSLIVDYTGEENSPLHAIGAMIAAGVIRSTAAPSPIGAIGYAEADDLNINSFGGLDVDHTSVVVGVTLYGDANFNGVIDRDDFALTDRGHAMNLSGWSNGDFDSDGDVDGADYLLLDRSFLFTQSPAPHFLAARATQFGPDYVAQLVASIPEPSTACGTAIFSYGLIIRRARKHHR